MPDPDSIPERVSSGEPIRTSGRSETGDDASSLPSPSTQTTFQFNQLNVQTIPQTVLERLSPEQIAELLSSYLSQSDRLDQRRFEYAMEDAKRKSDQAKRNTFVGGGVAIAGFSLVSYLAHSGNDVVAGIIASDSQYGFFEDRGSFWEARSRALFLGT